MDTPQVTPALLDDGLRAVAAGGCAFGAAPDGGYWAIGLRTPDRRVFEDVPMSAGDTGARQLRASGRARPEPCDACRRLNDVDTSGRRARRRRCRAGQPLRGSAREDHRRDREGRRLSATEPRAYEKIPTGGAVCCAKVGSPSPSASDRSRPTRSTGGCSLPQRSTSTATDRRRAPASVAPTGSSSRCHWIAGWRRRTRPTSRSWPTFARPVLDLGCGPGRHLAALRRRGKRGLGVDLSPVAVEFARGRARTRSSATCGRRSRARAPTRRSCCWTATSASAGHRSRCCKRAR